MKDQKKTLSPTKYPLKVQAIRSGKQQPRLYVYFPLPLAAAIGLNAGDEVTWELLDRGELHLVRHKVSAPRARRRVNQSRPKPEQTP
jgi:hypothetical protein